MAKSEINIDTLAGQLVSEARGGVFKPVYLLMGDEPYYLDLICDAVIANCVDESFKDFNEYIFYGPDSDSEKVISAARQFPMMSERTLVVLREAQLMKDLEDLSLYCAAPVESTVLVILLHKGKVDKRKQLYKSVQKCGVVVESPAIYQSNMQQWIVSYFEGRGLSIEDDAAALMAENLGAELGTVVVETEKMLKNIPEGTTGITVGDVEKNIGVSRQYSIFELTRALSGRDAAKAVRIAAYVGSAAKFAMPMATSLLFLHFNRILRYAALLQRTRYPSSADKAKALVGVVPYYYREYDEAVRNYPIQKCMSVISLIKEYDYKGKGGDGGEVKDGELLVELVTKILNF